MRHVPELNVRRVLRAAGLAGALAACGGSSLSSGAWAWCKENLAAVDAAARTLQIPQVATAVREPTWWRDYVTSMQNANIALIKGNPDFVASCDKAAEAHDVDESRVSWCLADGIGPAWTGAEALGLIIETQATTFAYRGIPLEQRIDNADFVNACNSAYASRTS